MHPATDGPSKSLAGAFIRRPVGASEENYCKGMLPSRDPCELAGIELSELSKLPTKASTR